MSDRERVVERRCRWRREVFRVPPDYPKRQGCPRCAPTLDAALEQVATAPLEHLERRMTEALPKLAALAREDSSPARERDPSA